MDETKQTSPPNEFVVTVGGRIVATVYEEAIAALLVEALKEIVSADFSQTDPDQTEPDQTEPDQTERADETSLVVLSKNRKWIGTLIDHDTAQVCLDALSGQPGNYRIHEIPKHPPLVEKPLMRGEAV
jgi:hypothetical protein